MREYRIQCKHNNGWQFITDARGKFYTYSSEAMARKHGPMHGHQVYNKDTKRWEIKLDEFRIVYSEIEWIVVDNV